MSLPWGGTFKIKQNLDDDVGHASHNTGEDADISYAKLSMQVSGDKLKEQRIELDKIIQRVFGDAGYWFHGGPGNWHWHVSIRSSFTMRVPMIEGFVEYWCDSKTTTGKKREMIKDLKRDDFYWDVFGELRKLDIRLLLDIT